MAAVTKYHRFGGWEQHKLILSKFWKSDVHNGSSWAKVKVLAGLALLEAPGQNLIPFPASRGTCTPGLMASSSISKTSCVASLWPLICHEIFFQLSFFFHFQGPLCLHWARQDNPWYSPCVKASWLAILIPFSVYPPLPRKLTYSQFLETRTQTSLGGQ